MFITIPTHPRWIRPDSTLSSSRHDKQARISRHNRAQTTPTHASGFHLFTVAMTAHAKERGSTAAASNRWIVVVLMQYKRAGARGWDFIGMNKEVLLAWHFWRWYRSSSVSSNSSSEPRLSRGDKYRQTRKSTINAMHNMMHDHVMVKWVCWANATTTRWVWAILNQRFNPKLVLRTYIVLYHVLI